VSIQETQSVTAAVASSSLSSRSPIRSFRRFARRQPLGVVALAIVLVIVLLAVFAPWLRTSDPRHSGTDILAGPSWSHWFGTNRAGTDMWSRVVYGARPALLIGLATVCLGIGGGVVLGSLAAYAGKYVDFGISRLAEFIISYPLLLFAIIVAAALGSGLDAVIVAISVNFLAASTRIMRAAVLQELQLQYVEASRVTGASAARVLFRHILPNIVPIIIVTATASLAAAILAEAAISFLGFGLGQGSADWGVDLGQEARTYFTIAPWLAIFPGAALSLTVLAFNLCGDALRDVLDPRLRGIGA
jgi:ABC-type dipeptide/oligopeptide/nickel transport system permease subunit